MDEKREWKQEFRGCQSVFADLEASAKPKVHPITSEHTTAVVAQPSTRAAADCIGHRLIALEIQENCSACNELYLLH